MRLLILTRFLRSGYGVSLVVKRQLAGLSRRGFGEIVVGTPDWGGERLGQMTEKGAWRSMRLGLSSEATRSMIEEVEPAAVIAHTSPYFRHLAELRGLGAVKIAVDYGEPTPDFFPGLERIRREAADMDKYDAFREFDAHISISEFVKKRSANPASSVLYLGADHIEGKGSRAAVDVRKRLGLDAKAFLVTYLARMGSGERRYKGFDALMLVKKRLGKRLGGNMAFVVMGKTADGSALLKKELQAAGFHVIDDVEENLKRDVLSQSDVYLSLSLWEGFDLPLVEAQYLGVPSAALSTGSHPEVCPFHFENLGELIDFLCVLHADGVWRRRCGKICGDYVRKKFRWDDHVTALVRILKHAALHKNRLPVPKGSDAASR